MSNFGWESADTDTDWFRVPGPLRLRIKHRIGPGTRPVGVIGCGNCPLVVSSRHHVFPTWGYHRCSPFPRIAFFWWIAVSAICFIHLQVLKPFFKKQLDNKRKEVSVKKNLFCPPPIIVSPSIAKSIPTSDPTCIRSRPTCGRVSHSWV